MVSKRYLHKINNTDQGVVRDYIWLHALMLHGSKNFQIFFWILVLLACTDQGAERYHIRLHTLMLDGIKNFQSSLWIFALLACTDQGAERDHIRLHTLMLHWSKNSDCCFGFLFFSHVRSCTSSHPAANAHAPWNQKSLKHIQFFLIEMLLLIFPDFIFLKCGTISTTISVILSIFLFFLDGSNKPMLSSY